MTTTWTLGLIIGAVLTVAAAARRNDPRQGRDRLRDPGRSGGDRSRATRRRRTGELPRPGHRRDLTILRSAQVPEGPALLVGPGRPPVLSLPMGRSTTWRPRRYRDRDPRPHLILAGDRPRECALRGLSFPRGRRRLSLVDLHREHHPAAPRSDGARPACALYSAAGVREVFWWDAFDGDWAARNQSNGQRAHLEGGMADTWRCAGNFVHTSTVWCPRASTSPSTLSGSASARACASAPRGAHPALSDRSRCSTSRSRACARPLQEYPRPTSSRSRKNDWDAHLCPGARRRSRADGSRRPAAAFVNAVAERIGRDNPEVAVDTLACGIPASRPPTWSRCPT